MIRIIFVLLVLLVTCAWGIIYNQNEIRKLNIELDKERTKTEMVNVEFEKHKLDCSILENYNRLEEIAREKLVKKTPAPIISTKPVEKKQ
jgi:cell division protein FtsL